MRLMYFLSGFPKAGVIVHCIAAGTESLVVWALVACICFTFFGVMVGYCSSFAAFLLLTFRSKQGHDDVRLANLRI